MRSDQSMKDVAQNSIFLAKALPLVSAGDSVYTETIYYITRISLTQWYTPPGKNSAISLPFFIGSGRNYTGFMGGW